MTNARRGALAPAISCARFIAALGIALVLAFTSQAEAAKLFISECASTGTAIYASGGAGGVLEVAQEPCKDQTPVDFSGGVASSAAFDAKTRFVRIICDAQCSVKFGASPQTATNANAPLAAMVPEYLGVVPGQVVSVIANP